MSDVSDLASSFSSDGIKPKAELSTYCSRAITLKGSERGVPRHL